MASSSAAPSAVAIEVDRFCEARVEELKVLRSTIVQGRRSKRRAHQNLSWHLRRRTLSYSARRAPLSVRAAIVRELASNGAQPPKSLASRRFRKYRSRARFLASMRTLRCAHPDKLETHLWHAKRFHMTRIPPPGHNNNNSNTRVVPDFCNDRGVRSAYRAFSNSSIAHDASYYDVVSIEGVGVSNDNYYNVNRSAALDAIRSILHPHDADRVASQPVLSGRRCARGLVAIDNENGCAIAPIDVLFRPTPSSEPSNYSNNNIIITSGASTTTLCFIWVHPAASKAVAAALSMEIDENKVKIDIRNQLQTFRVYGPRAGFVLGAVIERTGEYIESDWDLVRHARSPATSPSCCVLSGEMVDPRRNFPPKRVQSMATAKNSAPQLVALASDSFRAFTTAPDADSRIWTTEKYTALPKGCGEPKVDGVDNNNNTIPFIMMQRPGQGRRGLGSGWDVVLPKGWGKPFWRALMYANGARAMGITELTHVTLETDERIFPRDFPDSLQAQYALRAVEKTRNEWYSRRPKSKRVNYELYKVQSPFFPDLAAILLNDTTTTTKQEENKNNNNNNEKDNISDGKDDLNTAVNKGQQGGVRTNKKVKRKAQKRRRVMDNNNNNNMATAENGGGIAFQVLRDRAVIEEEVKEIKKEGGSDNNKFVRVIIRPKGRGTLHDNALICMPAEEDYGGEENIKLEPSENLKDRNSAKRRLVGRIVSGAFSMAHGGPRGVGFMKLEMFEKIIFVGDAPAEKIITTSSYRGSRGANNKGRRWEVDVLVRNCDSPHYRWATASISE